MIKKASSLILIPLLFIGCAKKTQPKTNKHQTKIEKDIKLKYKHTNIYQQRVNDFYYKYATEVMYEKSYEASILLDYAKFYPNRYLYIKKAFDKYSQMQYGIFSIFDSTQKEQYMQENRKYIYALFNATKTKPQIEETFNRWLNYKRTLFNDENGFLLSNRVMRAKKKIIDRKKRALARASTQKEIETLQQDIKNFERSLSADKYEYSKRFFIAYQDISSILKENELYIDFAKTKEGYFCFTLDKNQNITFNRVDKKQIDKTIKTIQTITNRYIKEAKKNYGKLYNLIFKNINLKNKTSLIISPDGLLNTIPFEAFYNGKNYLIEKLNIRYIPSGKEFVKLYKNNNTSNDKVIVFSNPSFGLEQNNQNRSQLKGTTIEALYKRDIPFENLKTDESKIIKRLYGAKSKIYKGDQASETNFFNIKSPKILHLSTHGFYLTDKTILNPMLKAGIALSGANESIKNKKGDGIVTALELSGMDLSHTELVVLSACETGVGKLEDGEGVAGINKAFMKAGAKYVVMSLWSVPAHSTEELMTRFYENLQRGQSYSEALRGAKIWWIEHKNSHPYFWGGFVGSGRD